jgi:hypothetical protein
MKNNLPTMAPAPAPSKYKLISVLILFLTVFQLVLPQMPAPTNAVVIISAIVVFLVNGLGALNSYLSPDVLNRPALQASLFLFILAIIGGLNELLNVIPLGVEISRWVRFGLTFLGLLLNALAKELFPSEKTPTLKKS